MGVRIFITARMVGEAVFAVASAAILLYPVASHFSLYQLP
jgi:hypothetical protein